MKRKSHEIEVGITHSLEGSVLKTYYKNKLWKTEDLTIAALMKSDLNAYSISQAEQEEKADQDLETIKVTNDDASAFAQVYKAIYHKYTRQHRTYKVGGKHWDAFCQAAAYAKKYKVSASDWVQIIFTHYSKSRREDKLSIPFPNQLHGDTALDIVLQALANRSSVEAPDEVIATRQAMNKRFVKLEDDQEYQKIMAKFKARTFNRKEFEYVRVRQTQIHGQPLEWLSKYDSILRDKEANSEK